MIMYLCVRGGGAGAVLLPLKKIIIIIIITRMTEKPSNKIYTLLTLK